MKNVKLTLDDELVEAIDEAAKRLGTSRSGFAREALRQALAHLRNDNLEQKHRIEYERHPVKPGEFDVRKSDQVWHD